MEKKNVFFILLPLLFFTTFNQLNAQEKKLKIETGADFVTNYIWRGMNLGGVSVQPYITLNKGKFYLTANGSVGFEKNDPKELDLELYYETERFKFLITDYWAYEADNSVRYFKFDGHETAHLFEASLEYRYKSLTATWNTNFAGMDYYDREDNRSYSTFISFQYNFKINPLKCFVAIGGTPWEGMYADKPNITLLEFGVEKNIKINSHITIPISGKVIFNPYTDKAHFVFGFSI